MSSAPRGKRLFDLSKKGELMTTLPDELLMVVTTFLDVASLLRVREVSRRFQYLSSKNEAGWMNLCDDLWRDKIHVSEEAKRHPSKMAAYRLSLQDATQRQEIRPEELCYDPSTQSGTIWSFRFKGSAGPDWTSWDPWWSGRASRKMVFLNDGTMKEYIPPEQRQERQHQGEHSINLGQQVTGPPFANIPAHLREEINNAIIEPAMTMTWRFVSKPMDLPSRPRGAFLRLTVGGRDVPTYVVHRSPTGNWGFLLESCWGVYVSFELPPRRVPPPRMRLRRTQDGEARWLDVNGMESDTDFDDEDENGSRSNNNGRNRLNVLTDDAALAITNEVQWREALLYNFGARVLPEGEGSSEEFDRTWGETLHPPRPG